MLENSDVVSELMANVHVYGSHLPSSGASFKIVQNAHAQHPCAQVLDMCTI